MIGITDSTFLHSIITDPHFLKAFEKSSNKENQQLSFLNESFFTVAVRLSGVNGTNYAGRVEVLYQGKWGKICRNEWDINDVKVVCRQLGFQSALAEFIGMDTKNETIPVAMSNVACTGQESVLASCKRLDGKHVKCVDNIEAQALCEPSKWKLANVWMCAL